MSFLNPGADVTGFMAPFNAGKAVNARNRADAFTKAGAATRGGKVAGAAAGFYGGAIGDKFMADAGAYANQQAQNAQTFNNFANLAGGIGSFGVQGGFNNLFGGAQMQGPDVGSFGKAWNTDLNIGGYTPSEIYNMPNIGYNPFGG